MEDHLLDEKIASDAIAVDSCPDAATLAVTTPDFNHAKSQASSAVVMQSPVPDATNHASTEIASNPNIGQVLPDGGLENGITHEDEDAADDLINGSGSTKKKKKSKSQKTAKAGSGFEEYYVDAPLTPAEHEQEKGLYHASLPFAQRIEAAIQRFAAKRNMDSKRKDVFDKYLVHGGIEGGPKMFTGDFAPINYESLSGFDPQDITTEDRHDITLMNATNFVPFDKTDPRNGKYVVDFEGCLKAFLSYYVPSTFDLIGQESVASLIGVIRNFMNYLLHHDVCPEYQDQIEDSKNLCDRGERELWSVAQNTADLPGEFNTACSELYGGIYQGLGADTLPWLTEEEASELPLSQHMSSALANQVFKMGVVANTSAEQFEKYELQSKMNSIRVTALENVSMEVVAAIPSTADVQGLYASRGSLKPLGKLLTKTWDSPLTPAEDLTEAEEIALATAPKLDKNYEFWVEDSILLNCFPGMKIDATVKELSIGVSYFDAIFGVYCSFFNASASQRMADWKEPEGEGHWLPMKLSEGEPAAKDDEEERNNHQAAGEMVAEDAGGQAPLAGAEEIGGIMA